MDTAAIRDNSSSTMLVKQLRAMGSETNPLDYEAERELIEKHRNDRDTMNQKLVLHNIRLCFNQAKKYASSAKSFDDLLACAISNLIHAATKFNPWEPNPKNPKQFIKFSTYATPWIFKACYHYDWQTRVEKVKEPMNGAVSLDRLISDVSHVSKSGGGSATLENVIEDQIDPNYVRAVKSTAEELSSNENRQLYASVMNYFNTDKSFTKIDRAVFESRFFEKKNYKEISSDVGISTSKVKEIEANVLAKFKTYLKDNFSIDSLSQLDFA